MISTAPLFAKASIKCCATFPEPIIVILIIWQN
jgi:hypothetical protein